jgi:hypothetical protein
MQSPKFSTQVLPKKKEGKGRREEGKEGGRKEGR